jgi:uncharacterized protein
LYIRVSEIPREGLDVVAGRGKAWIAKALEGMDPHPLQSCRMVSAGLFLSLEGRDLAVWGSFMVEGEAMCDRCIEPFAVRLEREFQEVLVPLDRGPAGSANVELHSSDLEIAYYDGAGLEVNDVFWEQVALSLPSKLLCREDCRGVCPRCGGNRNREECGCPEEAASGAFEILKTLKREKE